MNRRGFLRRLTLIGSGILNIDITTFYNQPSIAPVQKASPKEISSLVGYKGDQFLQTGIVYAPYIPLYRTPPWLRD